MRWIKQLILAVQFMTKIPIPVQLDVDERDFVYSMVFYPLVGLLVGAAMALAYYFFNFANHSLLPAVMAVLAEIAVTGAFHLDGLADICDALLSNKDRAGMLAIMKDSRIGTGGAVAIAAILALKIAALNEIPGYAVYGALLTVPVAGRTAIVAAAAVSRYARAEGGLGRHFIDRADWRQLLGAAILGLIIMALFLRSMAAVLLAASLLTAFLFTAYMKLKIGGMTGDTLGATCEITEAICLLALAAAISFQ